MYSEGSQCPLQFVKFNLGAQPYPTHSKKKREFDGSPDWLALEWSDVRLLGSLALAIAESESVT